MDLRACEFVSLWVWVWESVCVCVGVCKTKAWPCSLMQMLLVRSTKRNTWIHKFLPNKFMEPVSLPSASLLLLAPSQIRNWHSILITTFALYRSLTRCPSQPHSWGPHLPGSFLWIMWQPWSSGSYYYHAPAPTMVAGRGIRQWEVHEQTGQTQIMLELSVARSFLRTL